MYFLLQVILVLLYTVFDSDSLFLVELTNGDGWTAARRYCHNSMLEVENLHDERITDCMENVKKSFTGNFEIISQLIAFDGCQELSGNWSNVMDKSMQIKNVSVGECASRCQTETNSLYFALQTERCRCFKQDEVHPNNINQNYLHLCGICHDSDGICGENNATAVYFIKSGVKYHFHRRNLCVVRSSRSLAYKDVPCVSDLPLNGRCRNGQNVSAHLWTDLMLSCIKNGSTLSDEESKEDNLVLSVRRYAWFTSDRNLPNGWLTRQEKDGFSSYCSYVLKTENPGSSSYTLNYTASCYGRGRTNITHYFCNEDNYTNDGVHNWKECGIQTTSAPNYTTKDMTSTENFYSSDQLYHSSSPSGHDIVTSRYSFENTRTLATTNGPTKSSVFRTFNQTKDDVTSTNPSKIDKSKESTTESDKSNIIVPVVVGFLSVVVITVISIVFYCRRMSAKSKRDNSSDVAKAHVTSEAGGLSVQLNVNISAETSNPPLYAVVSKPKPQSVGMNDKSGDDETKTREVTDTTDEYYVSNNEEYDRLGTKRKHNRITSSDNEYNITDARTFDNNIYSLAKSTDTDGHVDGTYAVALNVSAEMASVPGNDTYDHSSPL